MVGALLCANFSACSSDSTVHEVENPQNQLPMQFGQAAVAAPVTRAEGTSRTLEQGFLVSCFKGNSKQTVMDKYEVKFTTDPWENQSRWGYVGTTSDNFYQNQVQRYWDLSAFPYQFYAVSPCPAHDAIPNFTLSKDKLVIPESFNYQTCNNGTPTDVKEPYFVAEATYSKADRVALPFRHIMSKVRFGIYSSSPQLASSNFNLSNVKVKVVSGGFVTAAGGYTATLATAGDIFKGSFTSQTTASTDAAKLLLQTDAAHTQDLSQANTPESAYFAGSQDGLLQIPQQGVKLAISFDINSVHYDDVVIALKGNENIDTFNWEANYIYTYLINISNLSPLTIEFSAQLSPWTDVNGTNIDTNLEK